MLTEPFVPDRKDHPTCQTDTTLGGPNVYAVEEILQHRMRKIGRRDVKEYLCKFEGYGHEENMWIPEEDVGTAAIEEYEERISGEAEAEDE